MKLLIRDEILSPVNHVISYKYEPDDHQWKLSVERLSCDWTTGQFSNIEQLNDFDTFLFNSLNKIGFESMKFSVTTKYQHHSRAMFSCPLELGGQQIYLIDYIPSLHFPI